MSNSLKMEAAPKPQHSTRLHEQPRPRRLGIHRDGVERLEVYSSQNFPHGKPNCNEKLFALAEKMSDDCYGLQKSSTEIADEFLTAIERMRADVC